MANTNSEAFSIAGIGVGGLLAIAGIALIVTGTTFWGIVVLLIGLVGFGGFVKGKWY